MDIIAEKQNLTEEHIELFKNICGEENLLTGSEDLQEDARDETENLHLFFLR